MLVYFLLYQKDRVRVPVFREWGEEYRVSEKIRKKRQKK